jgi:Fic family protein
MKWNWQQTDWPAFTFDNDKISAYEARLLNEAGILFGSYKHLNENEKETFKIEIICNEALKTSAIEGEYLNRDSLQSSIKKQFGLLPKDIHVPKAESSISEMMVDLYKTFNDPLTHKKLHQWHNMLMGGRLQIKDIGRYRTHKDPMQVVSGYMGREKVHFEAPPSDSVHSEMKLFIHWFNNSRKEFSPLVRAGIAHLYFVSIHPFEDGNGRIARAIAEKSLAQSLGHPTLIALSYMIEKHKKDYYLALDLANKKNEITTWLIYFAEVVLRAQQYTQRWIEFLIEKTKLYDRVRSTLNDRQMKVLNRMFQEGIEGFKGGLTAEKYINITKTSRASATRDLQDLVDKQALIKKGVLKHTRYYLKLACFETV